MGSSTSSPASNDDGTPQDVWEAVKDKNLSGQVFLVTGAYSGLGAATTKALLSTKATVIVVGRSPTAQADFVEALEKQGYDGSLIDGGRTMDLGDLGSVRDFAKYVNEKYDKIQCLICNAGVMNTPCGTTRDGFEIQMGTIVIGHFLLAKILAKKTARQVWLSSAGHLIKLGTAPPGGWDAKEAPRINLDIIKNVEGPYDGWHRYQQSKLGDILLAKQFAKEFPPMEACSVHPGVVKTNLGKHLSFMDIWRFVYNAIVNYSSAEKPVSPEVGARTQVMCATVDKINNNGSYYAFGREETVLLAECAKNAEDAKKLYYYCDDVTKEFQK
jgi:NAD(P)-dependent dehydrogenase (short-subunit alcohol dehydrogenase family)